MSDPLSTAALSHWLRRQTAVPDALKGPIALSRFAGGQSNPTYRIDAPGARYVLRRQPFGTLLPSAHAVDREYRLFEALHPLGFPVPAPVALCLDADVVGARFYIMACVEGRTFWDGTLPGQTPATRRAIYTEMIQTLARLHAIVPDRVGLGDFGRPGNFFARQLDRWTRQYRASQTDQIADMEQLITWLPQTMPQPSGTAIVHGDYRIDNLIFAPDSAGISAVIDWELATIGDPMADIAYLLMNWVLPAEGRAGLAGIDFALTGIPTCDEAAQIYCDARGRDALPDLHWYFAYGLFRLAAIVQGIKRRMIDGNASGANADDMVKTLLPLARAGWEQARLAGAR